jgi:hypothetical protein
MNLFGELEELAREMEEADCGVSCRTAYSATPTSRLLRRPVLVLDGEYRDESGESYGVLRGDLYQGAQFPMSRDQVEEVFALLLQAVCRRCPGVRGISRSPVKGDSLGSVASCQIRLDLAGDFHRFMINGRAYEAAFVSVDLEQDREEAYPIGETAASLAWPANQKYRGVITGCDLGEAEVLPVFTLEWEGYRYQNCSWVRLQYGSSGIAQKAEFVAGSREQTGG